MFKINLNNNLRIHNKINNLLMKINNNCKIKLISRTIIFKMQIKLMYNQQTNKLFKINKSKPFKIY